MPRTCLVIDDSVLWRNLVRQALEGRADVTESSDGSDAMTAYSELQPDWVLMDIQMAKTDGLTATRTILASHPQAAIAIVTQYNEEWLRVAALEAGAREFATKDKILDLLDTLFGSSPKIAM